MSETMRGIVEDDRSRRLGAALTALRWTSGDLAEVLGIGVSDRKSVV